METTQKPTKKNFWAWGVVGFILLIFILSIYDEVGNDRLKEQIEELTPESEQLNEPPNKKLIQIAFNK